MLQVYFNKYNSNQFTKNEKVFTLNTAQNNYITPIKKPDHEEPIKNFSCPTYVKFQHSSFISFPNNCWQMLIDTVHRYFTSICVQVNLQLIELVINC